MPTVTWERLKSERLIPLDELLRRDMMRYRRRRGFRPERIPARREHQMICTHCGLFRNFNAVLCNWRCCEQLYCSGCGRYFGGMGPIGCPCDERGPVGHGTLAEQPRPRRTTFKHATFRRRR